MGLVMWQLATILTMMLQDAANKTSLVSYCFLVSSIIPHKCGSGNDATIKIKTAMTPQVVLQDNNSNQVILQ